MSVVVLKPGIYTALYSTQSLCLRAYGVSPRGPMDIVAHHMANSILSNMQGSAVLECHFPGPSLQFMQNTFISITGGDFVACINDEPIKMWMVIRIKQGDILSFTSLKMGMRAYVAIQGGFVYHKSIYKEILKKGVRLSANEGMGIPTHLPNLSRVHQYYQPVDIIDFFPGPEYDLLSEESKELIEHTMYALSSSSNRMGFIVEGEHLRKHTNTEMLSSPVTMGTVQLLPNGKMIVLMADHNTTGGYPRILQVARYCLPRLSQLQPGTAFQFKKMTYNEALIGWKQVEDLLNGMHEY